MNDEKKAVNFTIVPDEDHTTPRVYSNFCSIQNSPFDFTLTFCEMLPIGAHSPGHVAPTDEQAREELWPHYQAMMTRIGAERGWPPVTRFQFDREAGPSGALYVGSPATVAKKIADTVRVLGLSRFDMKYSNGALSHDLMVRSIELYGAEVVPRVRALLAAAPAAR